MPAVPTTQVLLILHVQGNHQETKLPIHYAPLTRDAPHNRLLQASLL
jgi:hypothetical protein